jgi:predicted transcriptional regulator
MSNIERKRSEYVYNLSSQQMAQLAEIASRRDEPLLFVIMEAIDQYIEREKKICPKTP